MQDIPLENGKKHKIILVGNAKTGKSSLIKRFMYDCCESKYQAIIGEDFFSKSLSGHPDKLELQIWGTAGEQSFTRFIPSYLRDLRVAVITYDITNKASYLAVSDWITTIRDKSGEQASIVLVGTKYDLSEQRTVSTEEAQAFATRQKISYREVSAQSGYGIAELFEQDIVSLLSTSNVTSNGENSSTNAMRYPDLQQRIKSLKEKYPKDKTVEAIADILRTGLSHSDPQAFFNTHFTTGKSNNLRTHLNTLAYRWRSIFTSVLNLVIAVLQKVCAGVHALGYCLGLAHQQTTAYPAFFECGEKQAAKNLCNDVLQKVLATPRV